MIDWSKEIETTEDPPRPVRVLCTDLDESSMPVVIKIHDEIHVRHCDMWGNTSIAYGGRPVTLRNVAPPKPKPVLREAWVVWDGDGMETVWCDEKSAADRARHFRGVIARAAVMSDGSPVEEYCPDCVQYIAERDNAITERVHWQDKAEALQAENTRMSPVYDAAVEWSEGKASYMYPALNDPAKKLLHAIRAAQQTEPKPKAPDVNADPAGYALERNLRRAGELAAKAEPVVKGCWNCRWDKNVACKEDRLNRCHWEPRHD